MQYKGYTIIAKFDNVFDHYYPYITDDENAEVFDGIDNYQADNTEEALGYGIQFINEMLEMER